VRLQPASFETFDSTIVKQNKPAVLLMTSAAGFPVLGLDQTCTGN
jgi:hypothetical protein